MAKRKAKTLDNQGEMRKKHALIMVNKKHKK